MHTRTLTASQIASRMAAGYEVFAAYERGFTLILSAEREKDGRITLDLFTGGKRTYYPHDVLYVS